MGKSAGRDATLWSQPAVDALRARDNTTIATIDPGATPGFRGDKAAGEATLAQRVTRLSTLQEMLFANGRAGDPRAVLLVLQGMDTAGKGGIVRHVIGSVDPQGVDHAAFGVPTPAELRHHFLWRIRKQLPRAGQIGVFDRSHYEDVLVARVHGLVSPKVCEHRYTEINHFEAELLDEGTTLIKVAMFVSLDEQKRRLRERLQRPDKYWKFNPSDIDERARWPEYQQAYQIVLDKTSTAQAPWHVIPADRKWFARLAVTELLIDALERLDLSWPRALFDVDAELRRLDTA
jgi:PPK2 family polyphosphate:nucleotide phosphotransferase